MIGASADRCVMPNPLSGFFDSRSGHPHDLGARAGGRVGGVIFELRYPKLLPSKICTRILIGKGKRYQIAFPSLFMKYKNHNTDTQVHYKKKKNSFHKHKKNWRTIFIRIIFY